MLLPILLLLLVSGGVLAAAVGTPVRVGVLADTFPFCYFDEGGNLTGFDVALATEACEIAGLDCEMVVIGELADRIPWLQNGTVDVLAATLVLTSEREQQVDFVRPLYYTSGTALRALEANAGNFLYGWVSTRGQKVCTVTGHYLNDNIERNYGAELVEAPTEAAVVDYLVQGDCVAAFADSASLVFSQIAAEKYNASVVFVPTATVLDVQPYGMAVRQNDTELAVRFSGALVQLMSKGADSRIFDLEQEFIVANGGQPSDYLVPLVEALTYVVPTGV